MPPCCCLRCGRALSIEETTTKAYRPQITNIAILATERQRDRVAEAEANHHHWISGSHRPTDTGLNPLVEFSFSRASIVLL